MISKETMPDRKQLPPPAEYRERLPSEAAAIATAFGVQDVEKSLAALPAGECTWERLAALGDAVVDSTIAAVGNDRTSTEPVRDGLNGFSTFTVGVASAQGQRFRVLRPHAKGGLGAVFIAMDQELHREVALKQILDDHADDQGSRARFLIEAEITGGLEHPGIAPVYGLGTYADGRPYYAMRFIRGDSLKETIERFHAGGCREERGRRSLELRKLLRRFLDVCNAIEMLRRAVATGYRDVNWMRRDPDLDPLRSRSDFQVLLLDLAFPADPFTR